MRKILTPEQMQAVDAHMITEQGVPGLVLMEHAAMGVTEAVMRRQAKTALILCGAGNNGGDGLSVLRQLSMRGVAARACLVGTPDKLGGDAQKQYDMAVACGLPVEALPDEAAVHAYMDAFTPGNADVVVDALFGTGLSRPLCGMHLYAVQRVNAWHIPVIAVDIPSGVAGEDGRVLGAAIQAEETVTFQYAKRGHLLLPGRMHTGKLTVVPIGLPALELPDAAEEWERADIAKLLPPRPMDSHKGKNGRGLLIAGSAPYMGAAIMSARAALRGGTGLLHAAVPAGCAAAMAGCPAAICHPVGTCGQWGIREAEEAMALFAGADAIAIGPGMGTGEGVAPLVCAALETKKPLVLDADGLNALAAAPGLKERLHGNVLLTPHPGEMSRLARIDAKALDPAKHAAQYAREWGCALLLKGATSVIAHKNRLAFNTAGNTGLAKGGSGDVLTGILLALFAQGIAPYEAACAGAYLLGTAADEALALLSTRALLPTDVIDALGN